MSAITKPRRRLALRLAAAGALAAIPLAVVALPANAATPDDSGSPVVAQQVDDHGPWDNDRDHHDRDRHRHDNDNDWNGNNGWDNNNPPPAPAPWLPPTGSFGS
ncbi:hypothetical protein GPX89_21520 [Nocardia sp. ET3-3]|uniref:Uncharacterized protein n=1 Tax=Nocardia terrae TaxID=2675851 RepID=A0A7K1UZV4_9NOCA|nr:hypothetical protein [Nocardia terrae]MVU79811.1 hypothetical protein [Nocardia terrae]